MIPFPVHDRVRKKKLLVRVIRGNGSSIFVFFFVSSFYFRLSISATLILYPFLYHRLFALTLNSNMKKKSTGQNVKKKKKKIGTNVVVNLIIFSTCQLSIYMFVIYTYYRETSGFFSSIKE